MTNHGYKTTYLTITTQDGQKKKLKFYGKTQREAEKKRAKAVAEYEAGMLTFNSNTLFKRWFEEWLDAYKKPKVTSSTLKEIQMVMRKNILPNIGAMKLCDIRLIHVQKCLNEMEGMSKSYIHRTRVYINACLQKAFENGLIQKNPCIGIVEPTAKEKIEKRPLTKEEQGIFKKVMLAHPRGAFFGIMLACGLRPGETRALTWFNINMKEQTVTVNQAVQANTVKVKSPKTESGKRTIPIPDWYVQVLKNVPKTDSPYVFPLKNGKVMPESRYIKAWNSFMRDMDIEAGAETYRNKIIVHALPQDLTPYNLRHTFATEMAEKGMPMKTLQYLMGHSDIRVTANIYTHISPKMIADARDKMNG